MQMQESTKTNGSSWSNHPNACARGPEKSSNPTLTKITPEDRTTAAATPTNQVLRLADSASAARKKRPEKNTEAMIKWCN
jgi:hypothetical protein